MSTDLFVSGFLLSLTVCLDLGTVNIAMLRAGLQRGTASAFWLGVGSCLGDLVYAGLSAVATSGRQRYRHPTGRSVHCHAHTGFTDVFHWLLSGRHIAWSVLIALVAGQGRKVLGPQLTHGLTLAGGRQLGILAA